MGLPPRLCGTYQPVKAGSPLRFDSRSVGILPLGFEPRSYGSKGRCDWPDYTTGARMESPGFKPGATLLAREVLYQAEV